MRKRPQQERSRQMVETLIEATARTISKRGLDGTTTPLIAEAAGVSVGSLYQYFDGKEALLVALVEKLAADIARVLNAQMPVNEAGSLREMTGNSIRLGLAILHNDEGLYLELIRNWHRLPTLRVADILQQHFLEVSRLFFLKHYRELPIGNLQVRLFIIINSTLFTLVRLLSQDKSSLLREEDVVEGLTEMITGYLEGDIAGRNTDPSH